MSIKKVELRIGNWVFDDENKPCQISLLTSDKRDLYEGEVPENQIEYEESGSIYISEVINPIPLTDEWAVKFGYECLVELACDFSENEYRAEITSVDLRDLYVHQAQNLYFALKRKELTIK